MFVVLCASYVRVHTRLGSLFCRGLCFEMEGLMLGGLQFLLVPDVFKHQVLLLPASLVRLLLENVLDGHGRKV